MNESFLKIDILLGLTRRLMEPIIEVTAQKRSDVVELIPQTSKGADRSLNRNNLELILGSVE